MKSILIASPHSGCGKTSITLGLCRALRRQGLQVQPFKCGPDYLDPGYLTAAARRPCYNLDIWMQGKAYTRFLFEKACTGMNGIMPPADVAVIEGAMGLYDGMTPDSSDYSAAAVAKLLGVPVLLVCSAGAMSRSFAAVTHGMVSFNDAPNFCGVIANQCGSERHGQLLHQAVQSVDHLPEFYGAIQKNAFPQIKSRHLGLHSVTGSSEDPEILINALADEVEKSIDLKKLQQNLRPLEFTSGKTEIDFCAEYEHIHPGKTLKLGVAHDSAFHFYYPDNLWALKKCGFEAVYFSPLKDKKLPENLDGVYIGGGYPEIFASDLAANTSMLDSLRKFAAEGGVIYGECGGLMYLGESIECIDGTQHKLCGLLPITTHMQKKRQALGYARAHIRQDCMLGKTGQTLRGHEYHYSSLTLAPDAKLDMVYGMGFAREGESAALHPEGYCRGNVLGTYLHTHLASNPNALQALVKACAKS